MFNRAAAAHIRRLASYFPVLALTGPRQSGKTTLAKTLFADKPYVSLEDPQVLAFAQEDAVGFLKQFPDGAIFDEAQRWPELFSHLQGLVDADRRPGRFVLTGSQQFGLMAGISQSLAGRVSMHTLLPLSHAEASSGDAPSVQAQSADAQIARGGYPQLHASTVPTHDWMASYVDTYVQRDVRQLMKVQDLRTFTRFVRLCAGRTGQLLNILALGEETGVSFNTAQAWLSVLEASYIVHLLTPYHRNFGKRLVKSPKLYFIDTGLACWLLGIQTAQMLSTHPSRGALFETWVLGELLKAKHNHGLQTELHYWRDNNGLEADVMFETPAGLQTVEIKSGATVTADLVKAAQRSAGMLKPSAHTADVHGLQPWLIHGGTDAYERSGVRVLPWRGGADALQGR
jgi:uncharacterized protein